MRDLPKKPKFVIFDYGETLVHEDDFLAKPGFEAMLAHAVKNPHGYSAEALADMFADAFRDLRWKVLHLGMEVPHIPRMRWLMESCDIEFDLSETEVEKIFWDGAAPGFPTPGMACLLEKMRKSGVGTGVVSNIGFSGASLKNRIAEIYPEHSFDFIMSSCDYLLLKPNPHLFRLALKKTGCNASDVWFFGDNRYADISGAAACGIFPVYYDCDLGCAFRSNPEVEKMPECLTVHHWEELYSIFDA